MSFKSTVLVLVVFMALYAVSAQKTPRLYKHMNAEVDVLDTSLESGDAGSFLELSHDLTSPSGGIIKSLRDPRSYEHMSLENGMDVLLVSDPVATKAAASVDIGVGYFDDPSDTAGLAHFLEHMLFLGSRKYPSENAFESYIHKHGGGNNAYTSMEHTNFYFDIQSDYLDGALDRFAQFFVSPRLSVDHTTREMNAVNNEHRKNIENDGWRATEIRRHVSSKNTPYHKFGTGSIETLGKHLPADLRKMLKTMWKRYYTAGNIKLVVYGKESTSMLKSMVSKHFAAVRKTRAGKPQHGRKARYMDKSANVYDHSVLGHQVLFKPVKRERTLALQWAIPSSISTYVEGSEKFLANLLDASGKGTLNSYLHNQGWVRKVESGIDVTTSQFSLFNVEMKLTPQGTEHVDDIIAAVYTYLNNVRSTGVQEWRYKELKKLLMLDFTYKPLQNPQKYVSELSSSLRWVKKNHAVSAKSLLYQYNQENVKKVLSFLEPNNMVVFFSTPDITARTGARLTSMEPNYKIKYAIKRLSKRSLRAFHAANTKFTNLFQGNTTIALPKKNLWLPSKNTQVIKPLFNGKQGSFNVTVKEDDVVHQHPPSIIEETHTSPSYRIWHKQDGKFKRPKVVMKTRLWSLKTQPTSKHAAVSSLYSIVIQDQLKDVLYSAQRAGYGFQLNVDEAGVVLTFSGYMEGMEKLISVVAKHLKKVRVSEARFDILRQASLENLANLKFRAPYMYGRDLVRQFLTDDRSVEKLATAVSSITLPDVKTFSKFFYDDVRVEALTTGNIFAWQSKNIVKKLVDALKVQTKVALFSSSKRAFPDYLPRRAALNGRYTVNTKALDKREPNSLVYNVYQTGSILNAPEDRLYGSILDNIMRKQAYNFLRTKEQLGYIVWAYNSLSSDVSEFTVQVQSSVYEPQYVDARIQTFLVTFRKKLRDMIYKNPQMFITSLKTLIQQKLNNPTTLFEDTSRIWNSIESQTYNFNERFHDIANVLDHVSIQGFFDFYDRTFGFGVYNGKSLSVQISSHAHNKAFAVTGHIRPVVTAKAPEHVYLPHVRMFNPKVKILNPRRSLYNRKYDKRDKSKIGRLSPQQLFGFVAKAKKGDARKGNEVAKFVKKAKKHISKKHAMLLELLSVEEGSVMSSIYADAKQAASSMGVFVPHHVSVAPVSFLETEAAALETVHENVAHHIQTDIEEYIEEFLEKEDASVEDFFDREEASDDKDFFDYLHTTLEPRKNKTSALVNKTSTNIAQLATEDFLDHTEAVDDKHFFDHLNQTFVNKTRSFKKNRTRSFKKNGTRSFGTKRSASEELFRIDIAEPRKPRRIVTKEGPFTYTGADTNTVLQLRVDRGTGKILRRSMRVRSIEGFKQKWKLYPLRQAKYIPSIKRINRPNNVKLSSN